LTLLDQSTNLEKCDVLRILQVQKKNPYYRVCLFHLKLLTNQVSYSRKSFDANNEVYVKNGSITMKMVFYPITYIYKSLSFKNGVLIWQISDYLNNLQDLIDGINSCGLWSHAFYTSEFGYKLRAYLYLNGYPYANFAPEFIAIEIEFLDGEFDDELPKTFSYKIRANLLNEKELGIEKDTVQEIQYHPPNEISSDQIDAKQKSCIFKQFAQRQPSFLKVDCLLLKLEAYID